jgi:hypothetical protein
MQATSRVVPFGRQARADEAPLCARHTSAGEAGCHPGAAGSVDAPPSASSYPDAVDRTYGASGADPCLGPAGPRGEAPRPRE